MLLKDQEQHDNQTTRRPDTTNNALVSCLCLPASINHPIARPIVHAYRCIHPSSPLLLASTPHRLLSAPTTAQHSTPHSSAHRTARVNPPPQQSSPLGFLTAFPSRRLSPNDTRPNTTPALPISREYDTKD